MFDNILESFEKLDSSERHCSASRQALPIAHRFFDVFNLAVNAKQLGRHRGKRLCDVAAHEDFHPDFIRFRH